MGTYCISSLADRVGMPATTLRFYEKLGLLPSQRTAAGYHVYDDAAAERLRQLAQLIGAEQQCCPFFTFRLTFAGDHVELGARAPDGAEPLVVDLFDEQVCSC